MAGIVDAVRTTLAENFGGNLAGGNASAKGNEKFSLDDCPDLFGKVAVITGGSEGIGYGASYTFLKHNISKIYILSLSKEVIEGAKKSVAEELGQDKADKTHWIYCDLSDWASIPAVAKQITDSTDRIDILFNNAARGIMTYQLTDYGVDRHMALNHMGHVILTSHLLPTLKKTAEDGNIVRVNNQASNAHQASPKDTKFNSIEDLNQDLGPNGQYGRSKLAGILYAKYMNKHVTSKYPNLRFTASHPGFVSTKMSKEDIHEPYPLGGYAMSVGMEPFKKDQFEGAVSSVFACTASTGSGQYICPPAIVEQGSELANNEQLAEDLMKLTREIITEKTRSQSVDKGCPMQDY